MLQSGPFYTTAILYDKIQISLIQKDSQCPLGRKCSNIVSFWCKVACTLRRKFLNIHFQPEHFIILEWAIKITSNVNSCVSRFRKTGSNCRTSRNYVIKISYRVSPCNYLKKVSQYFLLLLRSQVIGKIKKKPGFYMIGKNCIKTVTNNVRQKQKLKKMRHRFGSFLFLWPWPGFLKLLLKTVILVWNNFHSSLK